MIRYPKRNIAQPKKKPEPEKEESYIVVPEVSEPIEIEQEGYSLVSVDRGLVSKLGKWAGILYPERLWELHSDIDKFTYESSGLSEKEKLELGERIPFSLSGAEKFADELLSDFMRRKIGRDGVPKYYEQVQEALSVNARLLFAYRCVIACMHDYKPDELEIYCNMSMQAWDFYREKDVSRKIDPFTGLEQVVVNDSYDSAYGRSDDISIGSKHRLVGKGKLGPEPSERDKLPSHFLLRVKGLIREAGFVVPETSEEAWGMLDDLSKGSSIEDRILGRVAYLITNAVYNKKRKEIE